MAEPRRTSTRRAVLSYDHFKDLYKSIGIVLPDLLVKDYQGILQDFVFTSDEIDGLDFRITKNEENISDLQDRILRTVKITNDYIAKSFDVVLCDNPIPIEVTLNTSAEKDDLIHVMRRNSEVTTLGLIDGDNTGRVLNVKYLSELYIYDGTEWSAI
jgi:hypothetical protein